MKYQIADLNNGPFGKIYDTPEAADFFEIVEVEEK